MRHNVQLYFDEVIFYFCLFSYIIGTFPIVQRSRDRETNLAELMMTTENKEKENGQMGKELTKNKRGEGGRDSKERYI